MREVRWRGANLPIILGHGAAMPPIPHLDRPTIPIAYLQLLVEILAERGFAAPRLLEGIPIREELLGQPEARMSAGQWTRLVLRALELTGEPALGYEYGLRMRPTAHGLLGYAVMSASSMRDAIAVSVRYLSVRQAHFRLEVEPHADRCRLVLRERFPIPVLRTFFFENILLGLARGYLFLLGRELTDEPELEVWLDTPEPVYAAAYAARLPTMRFDKPVNAIVIPESFLARRPVLADPHASQQAILLCERELALSVDADDDTLARVRALLVAVDGQGYPQLEEVASSIGTSSRTLKRRLHRSGTSFQLLLQEARERDAIDLLENTGLAIHAIAARLGYVNPANFTRAFHGWRGEPPSRIRERRRRGAP